jgi:hypothetical protein
MPAMGAMLYFGSPDLATAEKMWLPPTKVTKIQKCKQDPTAAWQIEHVLWQQELTDKLTAK